MNRKELMRQRGQIPERGHKNRLIAQRLLPFFRGVNTAGVYVPLSSEADIGIDWSAESFCVREAPHVRIVIPKTTDGCILQFYEASKLVFGAYGILEPCIQKTDRPVVPDLLVIPMLRFWNGYRMGYGKGCYDRYLASHPECIRIGIAYDEQEGFFEPSVWDERLDILITPSRTLFYPRRKSGSSQADGREEPV